MSVEAARDVATEVLGVWDGVIGTHYDGCWQRHVACLARVILIELKEES